MRFKEWLTEAELPRPVGFYGQIARSTEDLDRISYKHWREKGFTPAQILAIQRAYKEDDFDNPAIANLPVWNFFEDPHFQRVKKLVYEVIKNNKEQNNFFTTMENDPVANMMFKSLFRRDVTVQDVKDFVKRCVDMGIIRPVSVQVGQPWPPPTV